MRAALSTDHSALPSDDIAAGLPVVIDDGSQYVYGACLEEMVAEVEEWADRFQWTRPAQ